MEKKNFLDRLPNYWNIMMKIINQMETAEDDEPITAAE